MARWAPSTGPQRQLSCRAPIDEPSPGRADTSVFRIPYGGDRVSGSEVLPRLTFYEEGKTLW